MGNALDKLFNSEEPTKGTKPKAETTTKPKAGSKAQPSNMKKCPGCGEEVWPFHLRDGGCTNCVTSKKKAKAQKATPAQAQKAQPKTENRKRGLESNQWHEKEATYKQTSFLKKQTGLKTWDLEKGLTRLEASTMIDAIKQGNGGVKDVTKILVDQFGCVKYERPGTTVNASSKKDVDEVAALREQIKTLSEALTAMEALNEVEAS